MKTLGDILSPLRILQSKVELSASIEGINPKAQTLKKGEVFFAIRGALIDGHSLIPEALLREPSAIVVQDSAAYEKYPKTVLVDCTRGQLSEAASAWHGFPTDSLNVIAITGTNGKTTCSYLLRQLWKELGFQSGMVGTIETCIGAQCTPSQLTTPGPLELQSVFSEMVKKTIDRAVMEVSSIALDQKRTAGTRFQAAVFTNFTQDHLDYHLTVENYFQSKLKLFTDYGLPLAVVNLDDEWSKRILIEGKAKRFLTYSLKDPASDFFAEKITYSIRGTEAEIKTPQGKFQLTTKMMGQHNLYNLLSVLAVFYGLEGKCDKAAVALGKVTGAPGRLERVMEGDTLPSIFVDYAHTEDALKNVLEALKPFKSKSGRLITVFGCGGDRDKLKRPQMGRVASILSDWVVLTSDNPRTEEPEQILEEIKKGIPSNQKMHVEVNRRNAIEWALSQANANDIVLIAGKGHETYQIIGPNQFPFDDRQVVREYYESC